MHSQDAARAETVRDVGTRLTRESLQVIGRNVSLKVITIVSSIVLARLLGPYSLGLWALVTSTSGWLWIVAELGLGTALVPLMAGKDSENEGGAAWPTALRLSITSAALATVVYAGIAPILSGPLYGVPESYPLFLISALTFVPLAVSTMFASALQAQRKIRVLALAGFITGALSASGLVIGAYLGGLTGAFIGSLLTSLTSAGVLAIVFRHEAAGQQTRSAFDYTTAGRLLRVGLLAMGSSLLYLVGSWLSLTILLQSSGVESVGQFSVAWRASAFVVFPASAVFVVFFPLASESYIRNPSLFGRTFHETMRYALIVTVPITTTLILLAPEVITTLYGTEYAAAATILSLLGAAGLLQAISGWGSTLFLVSRSLVRGILAAATAVGLQVVVAAFTIPAFGIVGMTAAVLVVNFAIVSLSPLLLQGRPGGSELRNITLWGLGIATSLAILGLVSQGWALASRLALLSGVSIAYFTLLTRVVLKEADKRFIGQLLRGIFRRG